MKNTVSSLVVVATMALVGSLSAAEKPKFEAATLAPYRSPPKKSRNGKSMAEMMEKVQKMWGDVVFKKGSKPVEYLVTFETDAGNIQIEFIPKVAPNHVRSFICLSKVGFFDGLIFHRCIPGMVIQGGCPIGDGRGFPGYCLKAEFNNRPHRRGTLSMARMPDAIDSAGSQFFICVANRSDFDFLYTVFGKVTKGMDVVDKIVAGKTDPANNRPLKPVTVKRAKVTIKGEKKKGKKETAEKEKKE